VVRGTLSRFLPASVISLGVVELFVGASYLTSTPEVLSHLVLFPGGMAMGFGLGLEAIRRWLRRVAGIDGRRSFLAGLMSPAVLFIVDIVGVARSLTTVGLLALIGMAIAILLFFPWLSTSGTAQGEDPDVMDRLGVGRSGTL
jgi:hypothetical protein